MQQAWGVKREVGKGRHLDEPGPAVGLGQAVQAVHDCGQGAVADDDLAALALAVDGRVGVKVVGHAVIRAPADVEEQVQGPPCGRPDRPPELRAGVVQQLVPVPAVPALGGQQGGSTSGPPAARCGACTPAGQPAPPSQRGWAAPAVRTTKTCSARSSGTSLQLNSSLPSPASALCSGTNTCSSGGRRQSSRVDRAASSKRRRARGSPHPSARSLCWSGASCGSASCSAAGSAQLPQRWLCVCRVNSTSTGRVPGPLQPEGFEAQRGQGRAS